MSARGRSSLVGFTAIIKLVGTGPRGSRDLDFEEARTAMAALVAGETTDAQAGAFLMAIGNGASERPPGGDPSVRRFLSLSGSRPPRPP